MDLIESKLGEKGTVWSLENQLGSRAILLHMYIGYPVKLRNPATHVSFREKP